jgi:hypothetical protein
MVWSLFFAALIIIVVLLKYLPLGSARCPQCHAKRDPDHPLCRECGWIYEVPGDEDDDYGDVEDVR